MRHLPHRRRFLQAASLGAAAAGFTAASYARVAGANERISIGVIGCGGRGHAHMAGVHAHSETMNCQIIAVADPWRQRREAAAAKVKEWYGHPPRSFVSYRDLLALDEVDAVMIASCDHQHTTHLEAAAKAGKDVYCEKPLGKDFEKVKRAVDAVKAAGVVCQIGTQIRSLPTTTACRQLFQSGQLGKVARIEQSRNSTRPYWYSRIRPVDPKDVDWKEFLCGLPDQPFRADKLSAWYGYREFSDGPVPGLASHFVDLIHYITGAKFPKSATGQHGTFTWIDEHQFTCPDQVQATWIYPEGFMVSYTTNFTNSYGNHIYFLGEQGTLSMTPWTKPTYWRAGAGKPSKLPREETPVEPIETPDHFLDWLQCIRSRGVCRAPIEAGYQHAVAVIMAVKASDTGRRQIYDPEKREIRDG
ncbi:MAG TPA: Gfo/Idh/MocA family oxidoreductase [Planctomycetaceae bacterium]|nr:Gfo/Idh/MocA family oxidoreductase [Planctomycetaceae bacterium]HIQ21462.1 Gfo/Idh/MocA family oxidoreductase [Planctomycetota bacterium]